MRKFIHIQTVLFVLAIYCQVATAAPEFVIASDSNFAHPHDIEIDPSGQWLFVSDTNNHNIKVLDAQSLKLKTTLGDGELNGPHDVHFDDRGRLLVADSGNDRVMIYQLDGLKITPLAELKENMDSPEGVTTAPNGDIFVASTGNHKILKFHNQRLVKQVGNRGDGKLEFVRPHDIELGPDGYLYVGDPGNGRVQILTVNLGFHLQITGTPKGFRENKYLALDKDNLLYVADQHNNLLRIFNAARQEIGSIAEAGGKSLNYIEGVEVVGQRIWISDTYNDRIVLFNWTR